MGPVFKICDLAVNRQFLADEIHRWRRERGYLVVIAAFPDYMQSRLSKNAFHGGRRIHESFVVRHQTFRPRNFEEIDRVAAIIDEKYALI